MASAATAARTTPHPTPRETVTATLEDPTIKKAIEQGTRLARVTKYAAVFHIAAIDTDDPKSGRDEVWDYVSDFAQATYLALLEDHAEEYAGLAPGERPRFVKKLAMRIAWREVYPMKREGPLAGSLDGDQLWNEGGNPQVFACDDISLGRRNRHPDWLAAHALESALIDRIDRQRAGTTSGEEPETKYEQMQRLLGTHNADWMLDYENHRYESAKTSVQRVRYHRLRKKLERM